MEYPEDKQRTHRFQPRLIIHGGAGNILRDKVSLERYEAYRHALLTIISTTRDFMESPARSSTEQATNRKPSALAVATYAVEQLENNPLFNSGHGAVFTRDGINELEASVMVSRGHHKRGVGVTGLRHVRNPIKLACKMLQHGDEDLSAQYRPSGSKDRLDIPSAQGHTLLHGDAAEQLAKDYGVELVEPSYFYTKERWDEHIRALKREEVGTGLSTWDLEEYLPQGTCGAVALDETGTICVATSTGGMTNKLTGRIGDTPVPGAGFWAEEWDEQGDPTGAGMTDETNVRLQSSGPSAVLSNYVNGVLAECMGSPQQQRTLSAQQRSIARGLHARRAMAASGTGNGDSFMRTSALRTMAAMARWKPEASSRAVTHVAGPGGELQKSAGDRWGQTGEGAGGIIGIEAVVVRDSSGRVVDTRSEVVMDYNCGGMFRAWIDDDGKAIMSIWSNDGPDDL